MDMQDSEATEQGTRPTRNWHQALDAHGDAHGFHVRVGLRHGALYTEDDETLLVTFERAGDIRDGGGPRLPMGLSIAGRAGWSQLCLYCEGDTWFREPELYELFDTLIDEGFFDDFEHVAFYGAGSCAYAAAAFSVVAPGAHVLAIQPQATLDPRVTEWDRRFPEMRRTSFNDRYGYAPDMLEGADKAFVLYDPYEPIDAMHAALFTKEHVTKLRCQNFGSDIAGILEDMGILAPLLQALGKGTLTDAHFAQLFRRRLRVPQYLKRVLARLETQDRPYLIAIWTRAVLRNIQGPRFKRAFAKAEATLEAQGKPMPPSRSTDAA